MYRSFKSFRGAFVAMGALALIVGCTKPDGKPDGVNRSSDAATFLVTEVKGSGDEIIPKEIYKNQTDGAVRKASWRVPRAIRYKFNACIEDRATHVKAKGQTFQVEDPRTKRRILDVEPTTPSGCFAWLETIPFSYYVRNSRWVVVERDIVGDGIHTGRKRVRLALNPWMIATGSREHGEGFRFLREDKMDEYRLVPPEQQDDAFSGRLQGEDELIVDGVHIKAIRNSERSTGTFVKVEITAEPKVRFAGQPDVDAPKWEKISSGDFFVVAHLVMDKAGASLNESMILGSGESIEAKHADAKDYPGVVVEKVKEGGQSKKSEYPVNGYGKVIDGKLVLRMDAIIESKMAQGNLRLAMKLIPRGVSGLGNFEGIFELGNIKNMSANYSGDMIEECRESSAPCKVGDYLKRAKNFEQMRKEKQASYNWPYLFEKVGLRFVQVQPGETATQRTVAYRASVCVVDWFTGDKVVGLPFKVRYKDSTEVHDVETLADGCLTWTSNIFHYYYQPERFIERTVVFEKASGVKFERSFYINPWDDKFTFGFDEADFPPNLKAAKKIPSRFFLSDYGYHTVRFQYNIDSLMALEVKKTVLMELHPQVLRYSGIINARKMTEPLRDGIWLMKVAIQKNYLDPAQAGVVIDKLQESQAKLKLKSEPDNIEAVRMHTRLRDMKIQAKTKEYISTQSALVRVTDGVIIQPVELTMQDLRMMRVRSNFLVELEPVDERKLQLENVLHEGVKQTVDELLAKRQELRAKRKPEDLREDESVLLKREEKEIEDRVNSRISIVRRVFDDINSQLNATGTYKFDLNDIQYRPDRAYLAPIQQKLDEQLLTNDFTKVKLPSCGDIDCNKFVEQNAGLDRRTFVGPAIFLHNAYKDSVRATDNLDEARCGEQVEYQDAFEEMMRLKQRELFDSSEKEIAKVRPNNLYNFSEYFGSLRHLCFAHVDDLIKREYESRTLYEKSGPAVASIYNFAKSYNVDLLSLRDEKPKSVDLTAEKIQECGGNLVKCMTETTDRWMPSEKALFFVNEMLNQRSPNLWGPARWFASNPDDIKTSDWKGEDLRSAVFDTKLKARNAYDVQSPRGAQFAGCTILIGNILDHARESGAKTQSNYDWDQIRSALTRQCLRHEVLFDRKLRVFKTGQDKDPYIFLGGLQLNLNVGQGFSVSRSEGFNWGFGVGVEAFDFIGPMKAFNMVSKAGGDFGGAVLKPFNAKLSGGYGQSFGSSEGTSVSDSTYLVAQIAGFKVRLDEFERCAIARLNPEFAQKVFWGIPPQASAFLYANSDKIDFSRGVAICEGQMNSQPRYVKENYFYFTQHFTEGDMLDQADLYNHPWLLALRGQRDFAAFLRKIRKQEGVSIRNFVKGWFNADRTLEWPLDHMLEIYKHVTPSFPGFYTELRENERGTELPLERSMSKNGDPTLSKIDEDLNCEMTSSERRANMPGAPVCNPKFAR